MAEASVDDRGWSRAQLALFLLLQAGAMALAISSESLWIDEFWTAHFAALQTLGTLFEHLMIPTGSQTPLHFIYYYAWGALFGIGELSLRLANLPLFLVGQLALFVALRRYPWQFGLPLLAVGTLHPMVWQYANDARPYIMMYAGGQMMLAYLLHLKQPGPRHARVSGRWLATFLAGATLLFGASLLGSFWVLAACLYVLRCHVADENWRALLGGTPRWLILGFVAVCSVLTVYYVDSVLKGGGGSRIVATSVSSVGFAVYELLGLSGIGPARTDLRESGLAALRPYAGMLAPATAVVLFVLALGLRKSVALLGAREALLIAALVLFPVAVVIASGVILHWRVLGRHLIATLPVLNLLFALGVSRLLEAGPRGRRAGGMAVAGVFLLVLAVSAASMRFAPRHAKEDYRAAAALAQARLALGERVWWAADFAGAVYYRLPGEFDVVGEITGVPQPPACRDLPGIQAVANLSRDCLERMSRPDVVLLSKPEAFDKSGDVLRYLNERQFVVVGELPAFSIWRAAAAVPPPQR